MLPIHFLNRLQKAIFTLGGIERLDNQSAALDGKLERGFGIDLKKFSEGSIKHQSQRIALTG